MSESTEAEAARLVCYLRDARAALDAVEKAGRLPISVDMPVYGGLPRAFYAANSFKPVLDALGVSPNVVAMENDGSRVHLSAPTDVMKVTAVVHIESAENVRAAAWSALGVTDAG